MIGTPIIRGNKEYPFLWYQHLHDIYAKVDDSVDTTDPVATIGHCNKINSSNKLVDAAHLHFGIIPCLDDPNTDEDEFYNNTLYTRDTLEVLGIPCVPERVSFNKKFIWHEYKTERGSTRPDRNIHEVINSKKRTGGQSE